jgi:hypothetical protein
MNVWKSTICENINWCLQYCFDNDYLQCYLEYVEEWNAEHKDRDVADMIILLTEVIAQRPAIIVD